MLSVFLLLGVISLIFPDGGLRFGDSFTLHFPGPDDVLRPDDRKYADIPVLEDIIKTSSDSLTSFDPVNDFGSLTERMPDSIMAGTRRDDAGTDGKIMAEIPETAVKDEREPGEFIYPLEFPSGNDTLLNRFFRSLNDVELSGGRLRIVHYGDSQIENNRISSTLRNRFQRRFGGSGIGMFPVVSPVVHSASVEVLTEGNWRRHTPLDTKENNTYGRYGLLMSYSVIEKDNEGNAEGEFTIRPTGYGHSRSRAMKELSIFPKYSPDPFVMEVVFDGETINAELVFPADSLTVVRQSLPSETGEYTVAIRGEGNPGIHAVSLDDVSGIAVDNIPMRGSSGLEFSGADTALMRSMIKVLNVRLILLQFGVNVVPGMADNYAFYENALRRQLEFFRLVDPGLCIIVVGVSDMARKTTGGHFESYPNIELIRDAQRNAAHGTGYAFWDLYNAMGGRNSMPSWVMNNPPLGQPDYTHFTYRGSALVGDMLYNSIALSYKNWKSR